MGPGWMALFCSRKLKHQNPEKRIICYRNHNTVLTTGFILLLYKSAELLVFAVTLLIIANSSVIGMVFFIKTLPHCFHGIFYFFVNARSGCREHGRADSTGLLALVNSN